MRRALDTWLQTTESDSKQLLKVVIDNINSVRTIYNVNKAVSELGNFNKFIIIELNRSKSIFFSQKHQ